MRPALLLVLGLVLGFALGCFAYDYAVAKPDRERAASELQAARLQFARFDTAECSKRLEDVKEQFMLQSRLAGELAGDLRKCRAALKHK